MPATKGPESCVSTRPPTPSAARHPHPQRRAPGRRPDQRAVVDRSVPLLEQRELANVLRWWELPLPFSELDRDLGAGHACDVADLGAGHACDVADRMVEAELAELLDELVEYC